MLISVNINEKQPCKHIIWLLESFFLHKLISFIIDYNITVFIDIFLNPMIKFTNIDFQVLYLLKS